MHDEGRDILVAATLKGHPQSWKDLHDKAGDCAVGVLHRTLHDQQKDLKDPKDLQQCKRAYSEVGLRFGMSFTLRNENAIQCPECQSQIYNEIYLMVHLNDEHHMDFLTIARKMPN